MPLRRLSGVDLEYFLICYDENGRERKESDGTLLSDLVLQRTTNDAAITDIYFVSHGWKGDVPAAIEQYDRWIGAMGELTRDRAMVAQQYPGFKALIVGLHWPSLPWGDETTGARAGVLGELSFDEEIDAFARRLADTPAARTAIRHVLEAGRQEGVAPSLSPEILSDYQTLAVESGLVSRGIAGAPGADHGAFNVQAIVDDFLGAHKKGAPRVLGIGSSIKEALLSPLRQLSFWKMKDRARLFGEAGAHDLLRRLQQEVPKARMHLMGHSFGSIVTSAMVAGSPGKPLLPRAVDSLFLVQGALSLWSYAKDIPYAIGTPGYFNRILQYAKVQGPIVTTQSKFDTAVGRFYPLGARAAGQYVLNDTQPYPEYGGIGAFGIRGIDAATDMPMRGVDFDYKFRSGQIYNLDASEFIRNGDGASGAHSDIAHAEVAHAFWSASVARYMKKANLGGRGVHAAPAPSLERDHQEEARVMRSAPMSSAHATLDMEEVLGSSPSRAPDSEVASDKSDTDSATRRWFNVEIPGHDVSQPLNADSNYTLAFDVDVQHRANAIGHGAFPESAFSIDEKEIELTVELSSEDVEIRDPRSARMRVGRAGRSTAATFEIKALHKGPCSLKAIIHKGGNFIQQMDIALNVGESVGAVIETVVRGRPPHAAAFVAPRQIGISISLGVGGYDCMVWGSVVGRARLTLQPTELEAAVNAVRDALMKVVHYQNGDGEFVFQEAIRIDVEADRKFALETLARAGSSLFTKVFHGPAAGADSHKVGSFISRTLTESRDPIKLQVVADRTPIPWGMLYLGDAAAGAELAWENFIGMRHIVEQIPLQNSLAITSNRIKSDDPSLSLSFNVNTCIDQDMDATFVEGQQTFLDQRANSGRRFRMRRRTTGKEFKTALADATTDDQILYLYCHAHAAALSDPGGPDNSYLQLSDARVRLGDLSIDAPTSKLLRGNPLVIVNACESAQMSPAFYDGFVPYFMAKGARGVIGTECETPALFAAEWAKRFFELFLNGHAIGHAMLTLRKEFHELSGNPLGLLYGVYCDGDTQVEPAL